MTRLSQKVVDLVRQPGAFQLMRSEMKALLFTWRLWTSFFLVTTVIGLSAAFDSDRIVSFSTRMIFVYATTIVSLFSCILIAGVHRALTDRSMLDHIDVFPRVQFIWLLIVTVPVRLVLLSITNQPFNLIELVNGTINAISVSCLIIAAFALLQFGPRTIWRRFTSTGEQESEPAIDTEEHGFSDVPFYIQAEDHYVKLVREKGVELVRARISDLEKQFGSDGLRCHRSYWVSIDAIDQRRRVGRQMQLVLKCGTEIPVGRSYEKSVTDALLTLGRGQLYASS